MDRRLFALVPLLLAACDSGDGAPAGATDCPVEYLSRFCEVPDDGCDAHLDYDAAVAKHADCCTIDPTGPDGARACGELVTSTCGDAKVIGIGTLGLGTYRKQYYDAGGSNVAVKVWSDTPQYCGGTRSTQVYGDLPVCDEVPTVVCHRAGYIRPIAGVE